MLNTPDNQSFTDLSHFNLNKEYIVKLPEDYCRENQLVLLGGIPEKGSDSVALGMLNPADDKAAFDVERKINRKTRRIQLNAFELDTALNYGFSEDSMETGGPISMGSSRERIFLSHDNEIEFKREQSPAKMVIDTLSQAVKRNASDVHIEVYSNDVDVRFRIDGVLQQVATPFSLGNVTKIISHIKVLADLDIAEHRKDQDGRVAAVYMDKNGKVRRIDLRLSVLPGPHGAEIVMRVLDEKRINIALTDLGLAGGTLGCFQKILKQPGGLVIVAGPTASGKTTTLYSAIRDINVDGNKILTVEDPIEYEIPKVNQNQVNKKMSFADYTRAFMRQNPDILMIGEVRDEETASIAMRAAQMGHLVLTTLHSHDVKSALDRLQVLCDDRSLVSSGLSGILSQRLVRKICPDCSESYEPDADMLKQLSFDEPGIPFVHGAGCPNCYGIGYRGQVGVFELLVLDDNLRNKVRNGESLDLGSVIGFRPMINDAVDKIRVGITTVDEVVRIVPIPER